MGKKNLIRGSNILSRNTSWDHACSRKVGINAILPRVLVPLKSDLPFFVFFLFPLAAGVEEKCVDSETTGITFGILR